jgi:hypothetical protein
MRAVPVRTVVRFAALSALLFTLAGCVHHYGGYYSEYPAYRPPVVVAPPYYRAPPVVVYERPRYGYGRSWERHHRPGWGRSDDRSH